MIYLGGKPKMGPKTAVAIATVMILFLALGVANQVYRGLNQQDWPRRLATITSGPNAGRTGVVTSHTPFDLTVTINAAATQREREAFVADRRAAIGTDQEAWIQEAASNLRAWPSAWRWQVEFSMAAH